MTSSLFAVKIDKSQFLSVDKVKRGMILTGKTRIDNNEMKTFKIKVISVNRSKINVLTIQGLILDPFFKKTGVMGGMSGSPVYFKDKLVGALAYSYIFSKEPIIGITPIYNMLKLLEIDKKRQEFFKFKIK